MLIWALIAFLSGAAYSLVTVKYYRAVQERRPGRAASYDGLIGVLAAAPLQAWAMSGSSSLILCAEIAGSMLGTWIAAH